MNSNEINDNNVDNDEDNEKRETSNKRSKQDIVNVKSEELSDCDDDELEEYSDIDCNYGTIEDDFEDDFNAKDDMEYFDFKCINYDNAETHFETLIVSASNLTRLHRSLAKILLIQCNWNMNKLYDSLNNSFFESIGIKPPTITKEQLIEKCKINTFQVTMFKRRLDRINHKCEVCLQIKYKDEDNFLQLLCGHSYCEGCWIKYLFFNIKNHKSTSILCMKTDCNLVLPEDFAHFLLEGDFFLKPKYDQLSFREMVDSCFNMRHCTNNDCKMIIYADAPMPKRVECSACKTSFCFQCGSDYHAPADCKTIKLWYNKCVDDSETANYISAHTKSCPQCSSCIEKNGGCNHMKCVSCNYEFCWICLAAWRLHGPEYFQCTKYKESTETENETDLARKALKKYLFYFERWENHMKSVRFEDENLKQIKRKIDYELLHNNGTWIDWQYLLRGASVLTKCRYTLQYTYPCAYYMENNLDKELFEYKQASLENAVEELAWKIEHAETNDRGELENLMTIVEKRRTILLYDYFKF